METATGEATPTEHVVEPTTSTALRSMTLTAPKPSTEARVDPQPEAGTEVVVREAMIEDAVPLRSTPMPETGTSSHGGLELLDDELIVSAFMSLSIWSWRRMKNWIKVRCEHPELSCISEC
jgi:hypothetical protein